MHGKSWYCMLLLLTTTATNTLCRCGVGALAVMMRPFVTTTSAIASMKSSLSYYQLDSVESTQDEVRKLFKKGVVGTPFVAVSAKQQHKGRGTGGRAWKGISGNVFLTVALAMNKVPVPVTLLPLKVGILIAQTLQRVMLSENICNSRNYKLSLKWPNDVLVDQQKVAGVLIESEQYKETTFLLVGIGINVQQAPEIDAKEGRKAACVQEYCSQTLPEETASAVAADLAHQLVEWMELEKNDASDIVETWRMWAEFGTPQKLRETGEMVIPLSIQNDGQLRVRQENGEERLLMAEYLY